MPDKPVGAGDSLIAGSVYVEQLGEGRGEHPLDLLQGGDDTGREVLLGVASAGLPRGGPSVLLPRPLRRLYRPQDEDLRRRVPVSAGRRNCKGSPNNGEELR